MPAIEPVTPRSFGSLKNILKSAPDLSKQLSSDGKIVLSDAEWQKQLSGPEYKVMRRKYMEKPGVVGRTAFPMNQTPRPIGLFICKGCKAPLYSSLAFKDCETGWPTFTKALAGALEVTSGRERDAGTIHFECAKCSCYIGHNNCQRTMVNSLSLDFKPMTKSEMTATEKMMKKRYKC